MIDYRHPRRPYTARPGESVTLRKGESATLHRDGRVTVTRRDCYCDSSYHPNGECWK